MALLSPLTRLSPHFLLADFLGNHSVYSKGLANGLDADDPYFAKKWQNATALCEHILEPLIEAHGPLSISYGYISPEMSRRLVTYQDPDKPSHHRFDLGAAADVCVHDWVEGCDGADVTANSPAALAALMVNQSLKGEGYPLSRLITYSESPYLCLAASAEEVRRFTPRMAIYENRYTGQPKVKPKFLSYSNPRAQQAWIEEMNRDALAAHGWRGAGYPTHHGGGHQQYHHRRVSKYTMVSDWLFDLQTISTGARNIPRLTDDAVLDAFAAAGLVYDHLLDAGGIKRLNIVRGYRSTSPGRRLRQPPRTDWTRPTIGFTAALPTGVDLEIFDLAVRAELPFDVDLEYTCEEGDVVLLNTVFEVEDVLCNATI